MVFPRFLIIDFGMLFFVLRITRFLLSVPNCISLNKFGCYYLLPIQKMNNSLIIWMVLLDSQKYPKTAVGEFLHRICRGAVRCKNDGPSSAVIVNKNITGAFLHPSHAQPAK